MSILENVIYEDEFEKNHKVILDEMVKYIYLVIKEQVIGAINEDDMKSHGYYILKLLSLNYK